MCGRRLLLALSKMWQRVLFSRSNVPRRRVRRSGFNAVRQHRVPARGDVRQRSMVRACFQALCSVCAYLSAWAAAPAQHTLTNNPPPHSQIKQKQNSCLGSACGTSCCTGSQFCNSVGGRCCKSMQGACGKLCCNEDTQDCDPTTLTCCPKGGVKPLGGCCAQGAEPCGSSCCAF
jgi:hypothetical protein